LVWGSREGGEGMDEINGEVRENSAFFHKRSMVLVYLMIICDSALHTYIYMWRALCYQSINSKAYLCFFNANNK
jgi:hypothetical protein